MPPSSTPEDLGDRDPAEVDPAAAAVSEPLRPGATIGRFVVVRRLGAGGMGVVYEARDPELNRPVAVKVLQQSRVQDSLRLLREAQALAQLQHPNVVAVHDVGMDGERVYIAMELVAGSTLEQYLAAAPRRWREVLALFEQAGRGLAAAHAKSIVHRDFKPSNALVDDAGRVRVTDFGLARMAEPAEGRGAGAATPRAAASAATETDDDEGVAHAVSPPSPGLLVSPLTHAGTLVGTPRYMAPEQRLRLPATPSSDQYAFCVAVWEALHGGHPYPLGHVPGAPPRRSRRRGIPGWLNGAIGRGMAHDPAARHASMAALLGLLERAPRRRRIAATAAAGLALVAAAAAAAVIASRPAVGEPCAGPDPLSGIWDSDSRRTVERAFVATGAPFAAASFATLDSAVTDYAARWRSMRRDSCIATRIRGEQPEAVMVARTSCLDRRRDELAAQVELWRRADRALVAGAAEISGGLGDLGSCADAAALAVRVPLPHDPARRSAIRAVWRDATAHLAAVRAGRGRTLIDATATVVAQARGLDFPPLLAAALYNHATALRQTGRARDAEPVYKEALLVAEMAGDDERRFGAAGDLITLESDLGNDAEAARYVQIAEALLRRLGPGQQRTAELRCAVAYLHWGRGRYPEALAAATACIAAREATEPRDDAALSRALQLQGIVLQALDRNEEAVAALQRAVTLGEQSYGAAHPYLANYLSSLGVAHRELEDLDKAEVALRRAVDIVERAGADPASHGSAVMNLGNLLEDRDRLDDAVATFERAIALFSRGLGPEHDRVGDALDNLGSALSKLGRHDEAEQAARRAIAIHERHREPTHPVLLTSLRMLARQYLRRGEPAKAHPLLTRALNALETSAGPDSPRLVSTLAWLADTELALARPARARALLERALPLTDQPEAAQEQPRVRFLLARALWADPAQRSRANELAASARALWAGAGDADGVADVDAWLAARDTGRRGP